MAAAKKNKKEPELKTNETEQPAQQPTLQLPAEQPTKTQNRFKTGDIVFINKNVDADLEGFKLFPQYKKSTYVVEAYDGRTGVYSLRRLNLLLKLKEADIVAPSEKHDDPMLNKKY